MVLPEERLQLTGGINGAVWCMASRLLVVRAWGSGMNSVFRLSLYDNIQITAISFANNPDGSRWSCLFGVQRTRQKSGFFRARIRYEVSAPSQIHHQRNQVFSSCDPGP
jgi:hypothetical protein